MKPIGLADRKWRPKSKLEQVREQIAREDELYWAKRQAEAKTYEHRPHKFKLTETAKVAFISTIHFVNSCRP